MTYFLKNIEKFIEDKELQENEMDLNWRQMLKRFFENNNRINYVQNLIYIISLISFVFYVVCTYMPQLFKYLNYIDYFICPIYIIAHFINFRHKREFIFIPEFYCSFCFYIPYIKSIYCFISSKCF